MKIYFKDVGQGDSIILEWEQDGLFKFVLIDCNIKDDTGGNPVLQHLENFAPGKSSIELLILSHPHTDHFSGINEILDYAENNHIPIRQFLHTCHSVPQNLLSAVKGRKAKDELTRLFTRIKFLHKSRIIGSRVYVDSGARISYELDGHWKLKFLSPSSDEIDDYNSGKFKYLDSGKINRGDANLLSTSIKIFNEEEYVLLTSDLPSHVFDAIWSRHLEGCTKTMRLCQIAHHGSEISFNLDFWSKVRRGFDIPAIVSVGKNDYGHPSITVINGMATLGYVVRLTNSEKLTAAPAPKKSMLDMISKAVAPAPASVTGRDVDFIL